MPDQRIVWDDTLPEQTEVAVVGGGIAGCSIALALAERGVEVTLLERHSIASGASGRNDGQLLLEASEFYSRMAETKGRAAARDVLRFKVQSQLDLEEFLAERELEDEVEWLKRGCYFLASTPAEERELRESVRMLGEDGFAVEWHDADTVRRRIGGGSFSGGLFSIGDALVNPYKLTLAIARAAREEGARLIEDCAVHELEAGRLRTARGTLQAEIIVLATNAWTGELLGHRDWIWPIRGQILSTQPIEPFLDVGCSTNFGYEYWRQARDGRLVAGGFRWSAEEEEKGTELRLNDGVQARIENFMRELYGARAPDLRVESRWSGIMGFSKDGLPFIGPIPGRTTVWLAAGFTGYGMSIGFGVGECVGEMIAGGETRYPVGPLAASRLA